jgi:hypothetical protein
MSTLHRESKTLKVSSIRAPGDIESVRRERLTLEIGESYDATGGEPVDPIIVEAGTLTLRGGKHRFAAALNRGRKTIEAIVVSGTPEEIEVFALVEQVKRRGSTDAEIARLVELQHPTPAQTFPEVEEEPPLAPLCSRRDCEEPCEEGSGSCYEHTHHEAPRKPGRPTQGKTDALKAVAQVTGKSVAAVKQADYRARKAQEATPETPSSPVAACIDTFGVSVPESVLRDAQEHLDVLEGVTRAMVAQQAAVTRFANEHGNMLLKVNEPMHDAAALAASLKPASVCLWCKCTRYRKGCNGCGGKGWLTAGGLRTATDPKLKLIGDAAGIWADGQWVRLSEVK